MIFSLRFALLALFICRLELSLAGSEVPKVPSKSTTPPKVETKLTPNQQRGLRLLQSAEAMAPGLEPGMRAYVLWQVSRGYEKINAAHRHELLRNAFRASTMIASSCEDVIVIAGENPCGEKNDLQSSILGELIAISRSETEELLPQTTATVRLNLSNQLVDKYIQEKKFDLAEQFLQSFEQEEDFPNQAAINLMDALPPSRASDRAKIFSLVLTNFRNSTPTGYYTSTDLGAMVVEYGKDLPADLVLEAIDTLLDHAKKISEDDNKQTEMSTGKESVSLDAYQYRLFQLLPTIRELDPTRAEQLLREQKQMGSLLEKYPGGVNSFGTSNDQTTSTMHSGGPLNAVQQERQNREREQWLQMKAAQDAAQSMADTNPDRALELAMSVPLWPGPILLYSNSPRANTLVEVADKCALTKPAVADKALQEVGKILDQMNAAGAGRLLTRAAGVYQEINNPDHLQKLLSQGMKIAEKFYQKDADDSDPNQASKAEWPSTVFWQRLINLEAQVSPELGERFIDEIRDPEIQAAEKVAFGNTLLGVGNKSSRIVERHKDFSSSSSD